MTDTFIPQTLSPATFGAGYIDLKGKIEGLHDRGVTYDGALLSFEYGLQPNLSDGQRIPHEDETAVFVDQASEYEIKIEGLSSSTTYYYQAVALPAQFDDFQFMLAAANSAGFMDKLISVGPLSTALNAEGALKAFFSSTVALEALWGSAVALAEIGSNPVAIRELLLSEVATNWLWDDPINTRTPAFWDFFAVDDDGWYTTINYTGVSRVSLWYRADGTTRDSSLCIANDLIFHDSAPPPDWVEENADVSFYEGNLDTQISYGQPCVSATGTGMGQDSPFGDGSSIRTCQSGYTSGRCQYWYGLQFHKD